MSEMNLLFLQQITKMFLMLLLGFTAVKVKLMPASAGKGLSQVIVGVIRPCAIIYAFQVDFTRERLLGLLLAIFGAALSHVVLIFVTWLLGDKALHMSPVERASMIYSNSGNLLMPLIAFTMGQEWLFYTCAYMGALQVFVWTHGKSLICEEPQIDWKKALGNINIIAMAMGFLLFCARIRFPGVLGQAVQSVGNALGSTSMLSIGISFATIAHLDLKKMSRVLVVTLNRLIVYPLIMLAIFLLLRLNTLLPGSQQIVMITLLGAGAPTGVVITQIAQLYDKEADHASLIGVFTMLCSIVTMPTLIWVYEAVTALV